MQQFKLSYGVYLNTFVCNRKGFGLHVIKVYKTKKPCIIAFQSTELFWKREEETVDNETENKEENEEMKQEKAEELESKENENVRIFIIICISYWPGF